MCVSYDPVANGRRLQEIRLSRELTPEDVSKNTEVSVKALHAYESGERNPRDEKTQFVAGRQQVENGKKQISPGIRKCPSPLERGRAPK